MTVKIITIQLGMSEHTESCIQELQALLDQGFEIKFVSTPSRLAGIIELVYTLVRK